MVVYKRSVVLLTVFSLLFLFLCSCVDAENSESNNLDNKSGLTVTFMYCDFSKVTYIKFPDGNNMLINLGTKVETKNILNDFNITSLTYLVIWDNNQYNFSSIEYLIENCSIKKVYLPYFFTKELKSKFYIYDLLLSKGVNFGYTDIGFEHNFGNAYIRCLSPSAYDSPSGEYVIANQTLEVKNITPVFYISYNGVRFLLSSDVDTDTEKKVLTNIRRGLTKNVNLKNVDYYCVSFGGLDRATGFIDSVSAKTAIIHVSKENPFGAPSSFALLSLYMNNQTVKILRTDLQGNITINVP